MADEMPRDVTPPADETFRIVRRWMTGVFLFSALAAVAFFFAARKSGGALYAGVAGWAAWIALVGFLQRCALRDHRGGKETAPRRTSWRTRAAGMLREAGFPAAYLVGIGGIVALAAAIGLGPLAFSQDSGERAGLGLCLATACVWYFFANYAKALQSSAWRDAVVPLRQLCLLGSWIQLAAACVVLGVSRGHWDFSQVVGWAVLLLLGVLAAEGILRMIIAVYQPASLRRSFSSGYRSHLLGLLASDGGTGMGFGSLRGRLAAMIRDVWLVRILVRIFEPLFLCAIIAAWLSTCFHDIPLGSQGVRVFLGTYQSPALAPGLHADWPWPFVQIEVVDTGLVRDLSLGFDREVSRSVLWTEKHFEGEKNLLVENGETLLTINVPILYRISDPVAFLKSSPRALEGLKNLAERRLLFVTRADDTFGLMIEKRGAIAQELKRSVQEDVDRLRLGLEILDVSLKDIHPPVSVAPAYEEVTSAEEEKQTLMEAARAKQAALLPRARTTALQLTTEAEASSVQRIALAEGRSRKFLFLREAYTGHPEVFQTRVRTDIFRDSLEKPAKIIIGAESDADNAVTLDLRSVGGAYP